MKIHAHRTALLALALVFAVAPVATATDQAVSHGGHDAAMTSMDGAIQSTAPAMQEHMAAGRMGQGDTAGHEGMVMNGTAPHDHAAIMKKAAEEAAKAAQAAATTTVAPTAVPPGVEEHLGAQIASAVFADAEGKTVVLPEAITAPTIILPVYYSCPNVCNMLQSAFARVLPQVALEPGTELQVISLSFDENDTPETAAKAKRNFSHALNKGFPAEHWRFLTGDKENIDKVMHSLGFHFQRLGKDFAHPVAVIAVAPGGKIVRYLYGLDFLPFDITMAATEAAQGKVGLSVKRMLSFCYNYDPKGRRYVFDMMRVAGIAIISFIVLLLATLLLLGRKKRR